MMNDSVVVATKQKGIKNLYNSICSFVNGKLFQFISFAILALLLFGTCFSQWPAIVVAVFCLVLSIFLYPNQLVKLLVFVASFPVCLKMVVSGANIEIKNIILYVIMGILTLRLIVLLATKQKKISLKMLIPALVLTLYIAVIACFGFKFKNIVYYSTLIFCMYVLFEYRNELNFGEIVVALCVGVLLSFLFSLFKPLSSRLQDIMPYYRFIDIKRMTGLFKHPNSLSMYAILGIAGLFLTKYKKQISAITCALLCGAMFACGLFAASRSFLVCVVGILLLFALLYALKDKKKAIPCLVLVFVVLAVLCGIFHKNVQMNIERLQNRQNDSNPLVDGDLSGSFWADVFAGKVHFDPGRIGIWKLYLHQITQNPQCIVFGNGLGAPAIGGMGAHNFFLQVWYELGLVGILMVLALILSTIDWKNIKTCYKKAYKLLLLLPIGFLFMIECCEGKIVLFTILLLTLVDTEEQDFSVVALSRAGNQNKKVSIIVPVYKVEQFLLACVGSLQGQTYKNIEIILVDDGSPDNCPQMCEELAKQDSRIKVFHQQNAGLAGARNTGLAHATGDYVLFVDSDDSIHHQAVEILVAASTATNADISMGGCKKTYTITNTKDKNYALDKLSCKLYGGGNVFDLIFNKNIPLVMTSWAKLYKKELFNTIKFSPEYKFAEDEKIIHYLLNKTNSFAFVDVPVYNYLQRSSSLTGVYDPKWLHAVNARFDRWVFCKSQKPDFEQKALTKYLNILAVNYAKFRHAKCEEEILEKLWAEFKEKYNLLKNKTAFLLCFRYTRPICEFLIISREKIQNKKRLKV